MTAIRIQQASVMSLLLQLSVRNQPLSTATGFVVWRNGINYLITNYHVLAGRHPETGQTLSPTAAVPDNVTIIHTVKGQLGSWTSKSERLYDETGHPLWRQHPEHGRRVDVVALPLTDVDNVLILPYEPNSDTTLFEASVTSDVNIIGFPFGLTGGGYLAIWSRGTIASEPEIDLDGLPRFLVDSRTRQGQSGSPVIFSSISGLIPGRGTTTLASGTPVTELLGVYSGRVNKESDLGYVWKVQAVRDLLDRGVRVAGDGAVSHS